MFLCLVSLFFYISWALKECCYTPPCSSYVSECETDFIIIGVGTSGSVLAKLLTDPYHGRFDRAFSAVGLEWGEYHNHDPEVYSIANQNGVQFIIPSQFPEWSVDYMTTPDIGILNKQSHINYGRMLGGSGNHNYALAVHPSPGLMDEDWVPVGGEEWSYEEIKEIINKFETYNGNTEVGVPRGRNGPIQVTQVLSDSPDDATFGNVFFDYLSDNLPLDSDSATRVVEDCNANWDTFINNSPQFFYKYSNDGILRSSPGLDYTNTSVISPKGFGVNGRRLRVRFGALVDRILFNGKRAIAVEYNQNGQKKIVYARKEIIITALAINTPVILQRSGYGDADLLKSFGIDVVFNNPHVGSNLHSHYGGQFIVSSNTPLVATNAFVSHHAYLSVLPEVNGRRLVQILLSPVLYSTGSPAFDLALGLNSLPSGYLPYGFYVDVVYPASRGSVKLTSRDPSVQPTVFTGLFSDETERDMRAVEETLHLLYDNIIYLKDNYLDAQFEIIYPPASAFESEDKEELRTYIKGLPFLNQHWGGTCAMGTVVDEKLSLIGVEGVTIADLSVAPVVNDGNTQTMSNFIAEKAAQFLLKKHRGIPPKSYRQNYFHK